MANYSLADLELRCKQPFLSLLGSSHTHRPILGSVLTETGPVSTAAYSGRLPSTPLLNHRSLRPSGGARPACRAPCRLAHHAHYRNGPSVFADSSAGRSGRAGARAPPPANEAEPEFVAHPSGVAQDVAPQGLNVPGCADPHATDAHRSHLRRAADKAAAAWVARAAAKEWDTIQADLSVYRFCGETYTAVPRRTPEYRTTILAALQLADFAAAATRYPDLSTADLGRSAGNRDSLCRRVLGRRDPAHHGAAHGP